MRCVSNQIVGVARVNSDDAVISSGIYVDLENQEDIVLTEMSVELLDNDYDLFEFDINTTHRQIIVLGISESSNDDAYFDRL